METVGLTIVLDVAAVVGGAGAGALMADGSLDDVVIAAADVVEEMTPGGAVVPGGGPTGPAGGPCWGGMTAPCGLVGGI